MIRPSDASGTGEAARGLRPDGLLASDLWIDRPDASLRIEEKRRAGELSVEEAAALSRIVGDGYCVVRPEISGAVFDRFDIDVERLWREQPPYVAWAYQSRLTRFSGGDAEKRRPSCRVADLHTASVAALGLYLHPEIHRYASLVLGAPAIATQSLYFEWGSQQALHRDPIHVQAEHPADLVAAWIALEDIDEGSGPLVYVPGSHRLPYYEFAPGRHVHDHERDGLEGIARSQAWDQEHCGRAGLEARPFLARRGEVLFWHHSLLHGGSTPSKPGLTRKSFVVHFTRRDRARGASNTYDDPFGPPVPMIYRTDRTLELGGAVGYESPLWTRFGEEVAAIYAAGGPLLPERLRAMRASRFWRARDAWFRVKAGFRPG